MQTQGSAHASWPRTGEHQPTLTDATFVFHIPKSWRNSLGSSVKSNTAYSRHGYITCPGVFRLHINKIHHFQLRKRHIQTLHVNHSSVCARAKGGCEEGKRLAVGYFVRRRKQTFFVYDGYRPTNIYYIQLPGNSDNHALCFIRQCIMLW